VIRDSWPVLKSTCLATGHLMNCPLAKAIKRQGLKPSIFSALNVTAEQAAEKHPTPFVILSGAKNLSFFS